MATKTGAVALRSGRREWARAGRILLLGVAMGCGRGGASNAPSARTVGNGSPPETVALVTGDVTAGFALGVQRQLVTLSAFRVTRHPVTVGDYTACVVAGACTPPHADVARNGGLLDRPTYDGAARDVPLTGASAEDAAAYCAWTGGRLPRATEWLLAARGSRVQRYPWGDGAPSCDRHPVVDGIFADPRSCCVDPGCDLDVLARVGTHPNGASAAGLEDILLASGELVATDPRAAVTNCGPEGAACVVVGHAGFIDGLSSSLASPPITTTFRCAYEGAGQ